MNSIGLTWQISFALILKTPQWAADLLSPMSLCDCQAFPEVLFLDQHIERRTERKELEDDIEILPCFSFISLTTDKSTLTMHRLVQVAFHRLLETHGELDRHTCKLTDRLDCNFPSKQLAHNIFDRNYWQEIICEYKVFNLKMVLH